VLSRHAEVVPRASRQTRWSPWRLSSR